jgi:acyl-CoA reductase-like NAD-dependent aldehyde dehydrogenase
MDTYSYKLPLGVCAGITPFNFPAMIPLWMFPVAITAGNTFVMKPSEKDPGAPMMLAELAKEAGVPDGVLNIIHGAHDAVNFICDEPRIRAVSFVGSSVAGQHIYRRACSNGKRVQSNMAAKNHAAIMPDANRDSVVNALAAAAFGAAGQRCMALSTAVFVGESKEWVHDIVSKVRNLKVGPGIAADTDIGPVISRESKQRIEHLIQTAIDQASSSVATPARSLSHALVLSDVRLSAFMVSRRLRWGWVHVCSLGGMRRRSREEGMAGWYPGDIVGGIRRHAWLVRRTKVGASERRGYHRQRRSVQRY